MKTLVSALLTTLLIGLGALAQDDSGDDKEDKPAEGELKTTEQKASYGIGFNIGRNFKGQRLDRHLDLKVLLQGIEDALKGADPKVSEEEIEKAFTELQKELASSAKKEFEEAKKVAAERDKVNIKPGEEFLAKNAKREGVKTTESGLQYEVLKEGTGKSPKATDVVTVHYVGTFIDGEKFDSSIDRKVPAQFRLNGVIAGWTEGLQLMKEGAKYKFVIPSDLAYGDSGRWDESGQQQMPGHKVLVFEVELISVDGGAGR